MNNLIRIVRKEIEAENKSRELEAEKRNIRFMLDLIKRKENEIDSIKKDIAIIELCLKEKDYGSISTNSSYSFGNVTWKLV